MNRKNFGHLIEQLRTETKLIRGEMKPFTQKEMADNLGITLRHYGRLERGEVVNIEGELLVKLANEFKLTLRERQEFFYAAGGVSQFALKTPFDNLDTLWDKLDEMVKETVFPFFISDVVGNILLAGKGGLPIVGFDTPEFSELKYPNVLWAGLNLDLSHAFTQEELFKAIVANLNLLRGTSLRYRAHSYCREMINDLIEIPQIRTAWQLISFQQGAEFSDSRVLRHFHPKLNVELAYYSMGMRIVTGWGDLYATTFTPADEKTFFKFKELRELYGSEAVRTLARWPFPPNKIG